MFVSLFSYSYAHHHWLPVILKTKLELFKGWKEYIKVIEGIAIITNKIQGIIVHIISNIVLCVTLEGFLYLDL